MGFPLDKAALSPLLLILTQLNLGWTVFTVPKFLTIPQGAIMGTRQVFSNSICDVFMGIPYAQPPTGPNRFKPPLAVDKWQGTLIADTYGPACAQPLGKGHMFTQATLRTSEDCLYLNIFAPVNTGKIEAKRPVFVWIHGGGFLYGSSSSLLPEDICNSFATQGVVVVTFNYRLGPFGFLKTPDISNGNLGLWDQMELLRWVRGNIGTFGGDPNRVTLGGHGSGAVCASILSLSDVGKKLFNQAVIMSGSVLSSWAVTEYPIASSYQLTENLQCRLLFTRAGDCLANATTEEILSASPKLWSPVIDGPDGIISETPVELLAHSSDMPVIIGFTKEEAALLVLKKLATQNGSITSSAVQHRLIRYFSDDFLQSLNTLEEAVKFQYFNLLPNQNGYAYVQNLVDLYSDYLFKSPIVYEATVRSQRHSNVYLYSFEKSLDLSQLISGWVVSPHEADLPHLWGLKSSNFGSQSSNDRYPIKPILAELVGAFTKFGFIQSESLSGVWMPFRIEDKSILKIGRSLQMGTLQDDSRMRLWTMFVPQILKINENLTSVDSTTAYLTTTESSTTTPNPHQHHMQTTTTMPTTTTTTTTVATTSTTRKTSTGRSVRTSTVSTSTVTSTLSSTTTTANETVANDSSVIVKSKVAVEETNTAALWAMVGLALVFFFLFLFTAGFCAVWHKQSYCINRAMRIRNVIRPPVIPTGPTITTSPLAASSINPVPIRPETHPTSRPIIPPPNPALSARRR